MAHSSVDPVALCRQADVLRKSGALAAAQEMYRRALALAPGEPAILNALGLALGNDARYDEAIAALVHAAARSEDAAPLVNLGNALRSSGRKREAVLAYRGALRRDPDHAAALYNLHAAVDDAAAAREALARSVALRPDHVEARFFLAVLDAREPDADTPPFMRSSLDFMKQHPEAVRLSDTFDTLTLALSHARPDGLVLELGVRRGTSLRFLAAHSAEVHGFDSFEGLPSAWAEQPAGLYTTRGEVPEVPHNAHLHVGRFEETLPAFVADRHAPIRFINVDCDLYASTATALTALAPQIGTGTAMVFDEYLCNPGWENEEHRAFLEAAEQHAWRYRYVAFSPFTKQAAVVIT